MSFRFSTVETLELLLWSAIFLALGRTLGAACLSLVQSSIEPSSFVLGDEMAYAEGRSAQRVLNVRKLGWEPNAADPDFLDIFCRTLRNADRVLLAFRDPGERSAWAKFMALTGINAEVIHHELSSNAPVAVGSWAGAPTLVISRGPLTLPERVLKRAFDLGAILVLAPIIAPTLLLLAVLVKLESPGPVFFVQRRVGRRNLHYRCYKLRTMRVETVDQAGTQSTSRNDPRVTRLGRLLRKTSLDELPQLYNVLRGEMSLVGPRPHALGSTAEGALFWHAVQRYWTRHSVKPGLTGLAQIRGFRGATHSRRDIEERVAADLEYINAWSIWLDVKILLKTPFTVFHRNAF